MHTENKCHVTPCFQACDRWKKNNNEKNMMPKTNLNFIVLTHSCPLVFIFIYNVMVSRLHAINSVLTNTTNLYQFILVRNPFKVPGSKIPTQAIIDLIHGFRKASSSLQSRAVVWQSAVRRGVVSLYPLVTGFQPRRPLFRNNVKKFGLQCYVFEVRAFFCLKTFK